jgi:hypothetical protein
MKHLAIRSMSIRKGNQPYTTPGLGDMTHTVLIGYLYGLKNNTSVTLHLTADKWNRDKPETYRQLLELLPPGKVFIKVHPVENIPDTDFIDYIQANGDNAELYCYMDIRHKYDTLQPIDISEYLSIYPRLTPLGVGEELVLPKKFVTSQWDSTAEKRRLSNQQVNDIKNRYRQQGYDIIEVGGNATHPLLKRSLKHIGYAMAHADLHIGVDSGFMHFAQMYLQPSQIHLYIKDSTTKWSHHLTRAHANGCVLNRYLTQE